jgi:hypothetical protein
MENRGGQILFRGNEVHGECDDAEKRVLDMMADMIADDAESRKRYLKTIESFYYHLSAFLCAFRSITWIMQKEFEPIEGFSKWYLDIQDNLRKDGEMRLLKTARDFTLHEYIIPTCPEASVKTSQENLICDISWYITEDIKKDEEMAKIPNIDDIIKKDVVTICTDCIDKMEKIVLDCEQKFYVGK